MNSPNNSILGKEGNRVTQGMSLIFENVQERTKAATAYVSRKSKNLYSIT